MKLKIQTFYVSWCAVAPLVGAWIEIFCFEHLEQSFSVAPLVGAWIEIKNNVVPYPGKKVAPLVGAWIEILRMLSGSFCQEVAPLVGAWIEILFLCHNLGIRRSLLSWERGLKYCYSFPVRPVYRRSSRGSVD